MASFLRDVAERHDWLDLRFEWHGDELAFKHHLVQIRKYSTFASCLGLYGSLAASQVWWFLSEQEVRALSSGEMAHCLAALAAAGLALPTSLLSLILVQCSGQCFPGMHVRFWEPFWSLLSVALVVLLATRWHMVPDSGPSTSVLTSLAVVVFLAGLPIRVWVSLFLCFVALAANLVSLSLQTPSEGIFDMLLGVVSAVLLVRVFWAYEKQQRQVVLQESIQILQPAKAPSTAWSALPVVPSNSDKPGEDSCRRSLSGVRKKRSSLEEPSIVLLKCKADLRIEETTLGENAFFGEDVAGKELLSLFRPGDRKALTAAMSEANAVDSAVVMSTEVGQGRHDCFVRILPAGMNDQKWLALFCKDHRMIKNPPLQRNQRTSTENAMTQTNPLDIQLEASKAAIVASRVRHRNGTWTDGEVDLSQTSIEEAVQMLRRGATWVGGTADVEGNRDFRGSRNNTKQSFGALVHSFEHLEQASMGSKTLGRWHHQISSGDGDQQVAAAAPSSFTLAEPSMIGGAVVLHHAPQIAEPGRSGSFPGPLHSRQHRRSISSPRMPPGDAKNSITLSYSLSVSQASCSHTVSSASKAARAKEDASIQTDVAWTSHGWHCRNCSKPPKPTGVPNRLPAGPIPERRRLPAYHGVASMQGGWRLVDGPAGVAEWLREFVISGTTVHSKSHHFPLLEGLDGGIEMAGGTLEMNADGSLVRHGKSGHSFVFKRGKVEVEFPEVPLRPSSDSDRDTRDQDVESISRAMSFISNSSVRIGRRD